MADGILDCSFQPADEQASEGSESTSTKRYACSVHTSLPFALLRLLGADAVRGPAPSAPALAARAGSFCSASACCSSCAPRAGWTPFAAASLSCWARPLRSVRFFSVCAFSTANSMIGRRSSPAVHVMLVMHARKYARSATCHRCAQQRTKWRRVVVQLAKRTQRMLMLAELHKGKALAGLFARRVDLIGVAQHLDLLHHRPRLLRTLFHLQRSPSCATQNALPLC